MSYLRNLCLFFLVMLFGAGCVPAQEDKITSVTIVDAAPHAPALQPTVVSKVQDPNEESISAYLSALNQSVSAISKGDVNANGVFDYLVDAMPTGCMSCHSRSFYLFERDRIILEYPGDDYEIVSAANGKIVVKEPNRLENEPYCCPSTHKHTTVECTNSLESVCVVSELTKPEPIKKASPSLDIPVAPNGTYTNSVGNEVPRPYIAPSRPAGASALCRDGSYSFSQSRRGTCSHHGGVAEWY